MIHTLFLNTFFYDMVDDLMSIMAFLFLIGFIFREHQLNNKANLFTKTIFGFIGGLMGIALLINNLEVASTKTIVDLRYLAFLLVFYFTGLYSSILTIIILTIARMTLFDVSIGSIIYTVNLCLLVILFLIFDKMIKRKRLKLIIYLSTSFFLTFLSYFILLFNDFETYHILFDFALLSVLSSILIYYLVDYIETSNLMYQKYKNDSIKDFLTGLYNTRQYDIQINKIYQNIINTEDNVALFIIDIDHFKSVNDNFGHVVGDEILIEFSRVISRIVGKEDLLFRIGGEEFCLLSININKNEARDLAEKIRETIAQYPFYENVKGSINITVSIGGTIFPESVQNFEHLKESADAALYISKLNGRNKVTIE